MNISVQVSMSTTECIISLKRPLSQSLSNFRVLWWTLHGHPFNAQHALATLGRTTTELGKDFILIKCASLSSPVAMLEVHPTIQNSKALMVTLVPPPKKCKARGCIHR